ncbi:hypothetical protein SAY86_008836 [Trapa natans]|uniref:SPX domain-containing protein n=1 Tax=Trapa natans TaxID=22666 RepID=A0AAN7QBR8_TRANT|nr:hypothetical protein SAY86_008836 [Trapa natans]
MKFGKSLSNQIEETLPEWRDKFLSYKDLKRKLKFIDSSSPSGERQEKRPRVGGAGECAGRMSEEEVDFIQLLENELQKFNSFFVEKEEEYIIRLKDLQDRVAKSEDFNEGMTKVRREIVDFHGEMVLLENYSALNYTGLVKILKKYEKRTGALIRLPFIQKVLQEPFFTTDLLLKLVKECEAMLDCLFPKAGSSHKIDTTGDGDDGVIPSTSTSIEDEGSLELKQELVEFKYMESLYMKSTVSALRVLKEIRSKSSTVSAFSLPPLQISEVEETWKKIPILEQVAK